MFPINGRDVALQRLYRVLVTVIQGGILTEFGIKFKIQHSITETVFLQSVMALLDL